MKDKKYTVTRARTISAEWGKLQAVSYDLEDRNGHLKAHKAEVYDAGNAVAVLLYDPNRSKVLLARQFRIATTTNGNPKGMLLEVCAGKIEQYPPDETVRREIFEETGYELDDCRHIYTLYSSPGVFTEQIHYYTAAYSPEQKKGKGGGLKEEGEEIIVEELDFDKALIMINQGEIVDAKTVLLLQYAALKGLMEKV